MDEETRCYEEEMLERAAAKLRDYPREQGNGCRRCAGLAVCYCDDAPVEYDEEEEVRLAIQDAAYEMND